jgi:uncharacterized membrane protein YagU involved in acid resistance
MRERNRALVIAPIAGAVGGAAAAGPMAAYMKAFRQLAPSTRWQSLPPRQIVTRLARRAGLARMWNGRERDAATALGHVGYSVAAGALYPLARPLLPGPTLLKGSLFGVGLWGASYLGWLPAAGILRPATREPAGRNLMMISAHVLWGATTALVCERVLRRRENRRARKGGGREPGSGQEREEREDA